MEVQKVATSMVDHQVAQGNSFPSAFLPAPLVFLVVVFSFFCKFFLMELFKMYRMTSHPEVTD